MPNVQYPSPPLPDNGHIRLVELIAPQPDSVCLLNIHTICLDDAPDFFALSYNWGTSISFTGVQGVALTNNLFAVLMNLAEEESRLWWIDALCINQDDVHEKNQQVRIMGRIYAKAKQVCIWLGDPDIVSTELLRKIARSLDLQDVQVLEMEYSNEELEQLGLPEFQHPDWGTLLEFLDHPYFGRVWALQELTVAKQPFLVACGKLRFDWDLAALDSYCLRVKVLLRVFQSQSLQSPAPLREDPRAALQDVTLISSSLKLCPQLLSLEYLLGISYHLECADPRDKIVALLGLTSERVQNIAKIHIDYNQPVADFYHDVTGIIMTTRRSLKLLLLVVDSSLQQVQGLPSWVPDYSVGFGRPEYRYMHFINPNGPIDIQWERASGSLQIPGQIMDRIDILGENVAIKKSDPKEVLQSWFTTAARNSSADEWSWILSLAESENAIDKDLNQFWRTMIGDMLESQSPAPEDYKDHFAATIIHTFLRKNRSDKMWMRQFVAALSQALQEEIIQHDTPPKMTDLTINFLLDWFRQEQEKTTIMNPEWRFPRAWISRDDQDVLSFEPPGDRVAFIDRMSCTTFETRFFITEKGRMGRGPMSLTQGDQILVVEGTDQVFMVREKAQNYQFIGECYVHGLMRGEGREAVGKYQKITLV